MSTTTPMECHGKVSPWRWGRHRLGATQRLVATMNRHSVGVSQWERGGRAPPQGDVGGNWRSWGWLAQGVRSICHLVSDINLVKFLVIIASDIASVPLFSFWYSHYTCVTPFVVVLWFLDIVLCFIVSFSLCFLFLEVSIFISSLSEMLSIAMPSLLMSASKEFFIFVMGFFISKSPLKFFLEFLSAYNIHLLLHAVYFLR